MARVVAENLTIPVHNNGDKLPDVSRSAEFSRSEEDIDSKYYRLSGHFVPVQYELEFQPIASKHCFRGREAIQIEVGGADALAAGGKAYPVGERPPCCLVLHGIEFKIWREDVFIIMANKQVLKCVEVVGRPDTSETLEFYFDGALPQEAGQRFTFHVDFYEGVIHSETVSQGLFQSSRSDPGFLATHLEPTNARKLFPCFDEPCFKAVFRLAVIVDSAYIVVSNMPLVREEEIHEWIMSSCSRGSSPPLSGPAQVEKSHPSARELGERVDDVRRASAPAISTNTQTRASWCRFVFEETPPIQTCIVGFNVGKFSTLERYCSRLGILYRVVFPYDQSVSSTRFALDLLNKAVDFFHSFFNFGVGLKKIDLVALECFQSLGMENWGMITIHMAYFLVNDATPLERRQRIARLVGHEVCHHWFGNWLSIKWWNDIWLKEGLCRMLEYHFVEACFPEWQIWDAFVSMIVVDTFAVDAVAARTHPLRHCDPRPRHLSRGFDILSYEKGAALLRMLFAFIGISALKRAAALLREGGRIDLDGLMTALLTTRGNPLDGRLHAVAEGARRLAGRAGHPLLLIRRDPLPGRGVRLSQFAMPPLWRGVLPGMGGVDVPWVWDPTQRLRRQATGELVGFPILVLEAARGEGAVFEVFLDREEMTYRVDDGPPTPPGKGGRGDSTPYYFNYGATGLLRCDYDLASWRAIFQHAACLGSQDHLTITATLSALRNVLVGRFPDETDGDRCTLIWEWLRTLTAMPHAMSCFVWDLITTCVEELVYLVQGHDCSQAVHQFVEDLYVPLLERHQISFFATEDPVNFQALQDIPCRTVTKILRVLALCESSFLHEGATEMGFSVLDILGLRSLRESMFLTTPAGARSEDAAGGGGRGVDLKNSAHVSSAAIAFLCLVSREPARWWSCVTGIVAAICGLDTEPLQLNMQLYIPKVKISCSSVVEVLLVVLPAFFSMRDARAFHFMSDVLSMFSCLSDAVAQILLWNRHFLIFLLSHRHAALKPFVVQILVSLGTKLCSDRRVVTLLHALLTFQKAGMTQFESLQALLLEERKEETTAVMDDLKDASPLSAEMLEDLRAMTVNCLWIAYSCTRIEQFLRRGPGRSP